MVNGGAGHGLFEFGGCIFLSSANCGRYGEVIFRVGDAFYWPLPLSKGGCCREGLIRVKCRECRLGKNRTQYGEVATAERWPLEQV